MTRAGRAKLAPLWNVLAGQVVGLDQAIVDCQQK